MEYNSRGMRRRGDSDKWQVVLSHKDPKTGELVPSYHTVEGKTLKKAEKERDKLIRELERKGSACTSRMTLKEFLDDFIKYKEDGGVIVSCIVFSDTDRRSLRVRFEDREKRGNDMANASTYTDEYRLECADYVISSGKTATEVAKELGLYHKTLQHWVKMRRDQLDGKAPGKQEPDEVKLKTAEALAAAGYTVEFIRRSEKERETSADVIMDGIV